MRVSLDPQAKLALALTSAGSQRKLAAMLGVSHQKVGRWLREGEAGGVKQIPAEAMPAINAAFSIHKEITRQQARADNIPYFPNAPVFMYRPRLAHLLDERGRPRPGMRLVSPATEHIRTELRSLFLAYAHQSGRFWGVSIRSVIDWYTYITASKRTTRDNYLGIGGEVIHKATGEIIPRVKPIFTKTESFAPGTSMAKAVYGVEDKLLDKHQRHAVKFADEYLLQELPSGYDPSEIRFDRRTGAPSIAKTVKPARQKRPGKFDPARRGK